MLPAKDLCCTLNGFPADLQAFKLLNREGWARGVFKIRHAHLRTICQALPPNSVQFSTLCYV